MSSGTLDHVLAAAFVLLFLITTIASTMENLWTPFRMTERGAMSQGDPALESMRGLFRSEIRSRLYRQIFPI
jgi:hypothetical protein